MLESSVVKPTYALRDNPIEPDHHNRTASLGVRRKGDLSYLFLTGDGNPQEDTFALELPQPQHVYELLSDRNLGLRSRIEGRIRYGEAQVFALSPSPVAEFTAQVARKRYRPGDSVSLRFALTVRQGDPGDRLLRLEYRPAGAGKSPLVPRTMLLPGGRGVLNLVLPLNVAPGPAEVRAKDLTSGAECRAAFEVRAGAP
jgi:hypothetical protein